MNFVSVGGDWLTGACTYPWINPQMSSELNALLAGGVWLQVGLTRKDISRAA